MSDLTIERARGATYASDRWAVYEHGTYERGSVLEGQSRRVWLDDFATLDEARAAYPNADVMEGSTYRPPYLGHLRDED